jgi:Zn-dependent protease
MFRLPSIQELVIVIPVFLLALTIHEFAHGWVANRLGDPTARLQGRLTLNPLAHLDIIGTIAIVLIGFGWAKPVPVDARYLRNPRRDMILISAAGPASNLVLAVLTAFCLQTIPWGQLLTQQSAWLIVPMASVLRTSVSVNVILAVFNLLPVPPLDGGRIVSGLLPLRQAFLYSRLEPYGFMIIFLLFISGAGSYFLWPPVRSLTLALFQMWG